VPPVLLLNPLLISPADNRALSIANVMGNRIGKEQLTKLQEIMSSKPNLVSLCGIADDATQADLSGLGMDADDAIILASELPDKGALSYLNLASNGIGELVLPEGWSEKYGDATTFGYTHGDGREQKEAPEGSTGSKPGGAIAIANAIKDMGALSKLIFGGDPDPYGNDYEPAILEVGMTEADLSQKNLGMGDAFIISAWLTHKDNGALSKLIFGGDSYYDDKRGEFITPEPAVLEVGMSEADISNRNLGAGGAIIIAAWIIHKDREAMTSLNLAENCMGADGAKHIAAAIKVILTSDFVSI
jgi:hypothetical protein